MAQVPIGIQSFREIREIGAYYIDKTALIDEILGNYATKVFLFTRPRRFGKSTNLSMLDAYLNINYKGNTWFDGLKVSDLRPEDDCKNAFPVIYLDMKTLWGGSYDDTLSRFSECVSNICMEFEYLLDSEKLNDTLKARLMSYIDETCPVSRLASSLFNLSMMLSKHHGTRVIVLIDEYDGPLNNAYGSPDQRKTLEFIRNMLSDLLKGNENLRLGVVTGIMQIAKESIFSGFNNPKVNSILSTDMDEMFGFTPMEVETLCADFDRPEKFDEVREWYDGYRFGDAEIYNPWSLLSYVSSGFKPDTYWAGTSGNSIIGDLLAVPDQETFDNLMRLGSGEAISTDIKPGVTFADISDLGSGIYSVLAFSGYLTTVPDGDGYALRIPNREMYRVFADMVTSHLASDVSPALRKLSAAILSNDVESMGGCLDNLFKRSISGRVLDNEHSYQAFIMGLLMSLAGNYRITADFESGDGYHDIRMERVRGNSPNVLIEIKRSRDSDASEEDMRSLAKEALVQIKDRDYAHGLSGRTILYGIAFSGKTPTIVSEELPRHRRLRSIPRLFGGSFLFVIS